MRFKTTLCILIKKPLSRSANANVSSAILASSVILSEENNEYLIDVDNIFLTESIHQISRGFVPGGANKNPFKIGRLAKKEQNIQI